MLHYALARHQSPVVSPALSSLAALERETDVMTLFPYHPAKGAGSSGILGFLSGERETSYQERLEKFLRKRIKRWTSTLDDELERVRFTPNELRKLQGVINKIYLHGKLILLKDKLQKKKLCSAKTKKAIDRLEKIMTRVISAPKLEAPQRAGLYSSRNIVLRRSRRGLLGFPGPLFSVLRPPAAEASPASCQSSSPEKTLRRAKSAPQLTCTLEQEAKEFPNLSLVRETRKAVEEKLMIKRAANEVVIFDRRWGKGWQERLIGGVKKTEDQKILCQIGAKVQPLEMLTVLNALIDDQRQCWKIIYLLGSLRHEMFVETVQSLSPDLLGRVNGALRHSTPEQKDWFEGAFSLHRNGYVKSCNWMKDRIDDLADRFRQDNKGHLLSMADLAPLQEYADNIKLRIKGINDFLLPLVEGVIWHPETRHVLFSGVIREYRVLLVRLTETRNYDERPAGCLLPIIYRNVFERADVDDEEEAFEIFAEWNVISPENYREAGLYGEISSEELQTLRERTNVFVLANSNLEKLGITTVQDWKRLRIFNGQMLQEYLANPEIRASLTRWSREAI